MKNQEKFHNYIQSNIFEYGSKVCNITEDIAKLIAEILIEHNFGYEHEINTEHGHDIDFQKINSLACANEIAVRTVFTLGYMSSQMSDSITDLNIVFEKVKAQIEDEDKPNWQLFSHFLITASDVKFEGQADNYYDILEECGFELDYENK